MSTIKKVVLIGALPPAYSGQTIAFKILNNYFSKKDTKFETVNITGSFNGENKFFSSSLRSAEYLLISFKLLFLLIRGYNIVYLQLSQSKRGFLRDKLIIEMASLFNCKIIGHLHGGNYNGLYYALNKVQRDVVKNTLLKLDKIVVLSENLKSMFDFERKLFKKIVVVPNGIGSKNELAYKTKDTGKDFISILYLSNMIESKGYLVVLESIKILKEKYGLNVKASFCGYFDVESDVSSFANVEDARAEFLSKIEEYNLSNAVSYEGVVVGDQKRNILEESDYFILPTNYSNEGQPISVIEAMSSGCIVITTNYRALPEMISDGFNGFLLKSIDPSEIAEIINRCQSEPSKIKQIQANALATYNNKFTEGVHCELLYNIIVSNN